MSGGVFAVARNIFEHPKFAQEPFTEREAWIWLIREAAWRKRTVRVGKKVCEVDRGQLVSTTRFMASKWQWSEAKVRRFLKSLKSDAMIDAVSDALATQITICNYDEYQKVSLPSDAVSDAVSDALATQQRRTGDANKNTGENNSNTGEDIPLRGSAALPAKSTEAEVFALGKRVLGKNAGGVIVNLRKACEYDDAYALELLWKASEKHDPMAWLQAAIKSAADRPYRGVAGFQSDGPAIESREDREWAKREAEIYRNVL